MEPTQPFGDCGSPAEAGVLSGGLCAHFSARKSPSAVGAREITRAMAAPYWLIWNSRSRAPWSWSPSCSFVPSYNRSLLPAQQEIIFGGLPFSGEYFANRQTPVQPFLLFTSNFLGLGNNVVLKRRGGYYQPRLF
jgi:hypothetical protein